MKIAALSPLIIGLLLVSLNAEEAYASSSSSTVPLIGTVKAPLADSTTEDVALNGKFHVVVGTSSSGDLRIHANLADVTGFGSQSGSTYRGVGSTSFVLHNLGELPSFTFDFNLIRVPPNPCLDSTAGGSDNAASVFPLEVTFSVRESELGFWVPTISCVASYPPSPCLSGD